MGRRWSLGEDNKLQHFAQYGISAVRSEIPGRSTTAIHQRACKLGIRIKYVRHFFDTRWRGKLPIPKSAHPLVRELYRRMNTEAATITEVAETSGLAPAAISDWRYRRQPRVDNLEAAGNVVGLRLAWVVDQT